MGGCFSEHIIKPLPSNKVINSKYTDFIKNLIREKEKIRKRYTRSRNKEIHKNNIHSEPITIYI